MNVIKNDLGKSRVEFTVELTVEEFEPYIKRGAEELSKDIKIDGFRPGKVPYNLLKQKVGELSILEQGARIAINKLIGEVFAAEEDLTPIGHPEINITKLAPGNPMEFKVVVSALPEVTLGTYKGLGVKKEKVEVTQEDVDKTIEQLREMRIKEAGVAREVQDTDKVIIDLEMFLDNVPVEGGQGKGISVIIGKEYIVPGFEKHLIGAKKGDTREFKVQYPDKYHMAHLSGKLVEFRVEVKEVFSRELPEADDGFAVSLNFKDMEDLKANIRKNIEDERGHQNEQKLEIELLNKVVEGSKFGDIPEMLINDEAHSMLHEIEHDIERQGGKFEDYLSSIKKTHDELLLDLAPEAVKRIKTILSIRAIAKTEKIEVSEKDIDDEIESLIRRYQGYQKIEDHVKDPSYRRQLHNTLINRKVVGKLKEWNRSGSKTENEIEKKEK